MRPEARNKGSRAEPSRLASFRAQWDAVSTGATQRRRAASVESSGENGSGSGQLPPSKRLLLVNLCRDACRNFATAKNIVRQIAVNTLGTEFKLRFKAEGDEYRAAERWFNTVFARRCDFRSDRHLSDFNSLLLQSVARDGDCGLAFDGALLKTGRLLAYEADQICDLTELPAGFSAMSDGVLLDRFGRETGYITTGAHGRVVVDPKDATIWRRDPDDPGASMFTLLRMPWRFGQTRGVSELAACVSDLLDCYEMRSKELQSAKVAASLAAKVTRTAAPLPPALNPVLDPNLDVSVAKEVAQQADEHEELQNYVNLEALTGGNTIYGQNGDNIEFLDPHQRPNLNMEEFAKRVIKTAASGVGLSGCFALLEAEGSYTAFRGSIMLAWSQVKVWQKWVERHIQDWEAAHALRFAMETGAVPRLPDGWEYRMAWRHPTMPQVDPLKDQQAFLAAYKNGTTSLQDELGMAYRERLEETAQEVADFQRAGIPHPLFQTASGGLIDQPQKEGNE